jgi:predicted ArsR family transcriptional regulator
VNRLSADILGPGLGDTQRRVLLMLKRRGPSTRSELGAELDFAPATLREHLQALAERGVVERQGARRNGPGRPQVIYRLTRAGEALFPRREGQVLEDLARYLIERGRTDLLGDFLARRIAARKPAALERVSALRGPERLAEVARILAEEGYMAEIEPGADGAPVLKLCHCPIRDLVAVTQAPCQAEIAFVEALLGRPLARTEFLPDGGRSCSYLPVSG